MKSVHGLDEEFVTAINRHFYNPGDLDQYDHIRLVWALRGSESKVIDAFKEIWWRAPEAFHLTMTTAWVKIIQAELADEKFQEFRLIANKHQNLFDPSLIYEYYTSDKLESGRESWVEPDVKPLPSYC